MSEGKQSLKDRFMELKPAVRMALIVGAVFLIIILVLLFKPASKNYKAQKQDINAPVTKAEMLLPQPKDRTPEQVAGEVSALRNSVMDIRKDIAKGKDEQRALLARLDEALKEIKTNGSGGRVNQELIEQIQILKKRIDDVESAKELTGTSTSNPLSEPEPNLPLPHAPSGAKDNTPKIVVVGGGQTQKSKGDPKGREAAPYVPANSMFEGQLLVGMDAPTDQSAKQNPVPALIRVKGEAILPNLFNVPNVQECFVSVAGWGDMSDERAKMRTEMLSCVVASKERGVPPKVIEAKIDGYVVGEDGRVGMRGRLVSKQGQLIAKTLFAGVMSGLGDAMKPQQIKGLDINPGSTVETQRYDASTIGESALARGISDTAKSVSEYYLKLADQMMPIVEIDAGRKLTVVLLKGVELK
jgi:conjugal transfer pilus assembly protein TraB